MSIITPPPTGGPQILWHELGRRWRAILAGIMIGGLLAAAYVTFLPGAHTATSTVTIATPSPTPAPAARTSLSSTDMVTEKAIAKSATTLQRARESLGETDLTLNDLSKTLDVEGDTNGTIVTIAWSGRTRSQAVEVTNAITAAYIGQRTALVEQRADEMSASITDRINALNNEAAGINSSTSQGSARAEAIQAEITELLKQQDQLGAYHATSAQVLTFAENSSDETTPSRRRVLIAGLAIGLVLGLAVGLIRERREKRVLSARQLSDLTGLPVWGAQIEAGAATQWDAPAQVAALAIGKESDLIVLADGGDTRALAFNRALGRARRAQDAAAPVLVDCRMPLAEVVEQLGVGGRILIGTSTGAPLAELHGLLEQLDVANRDVVGLVLLDGEVPSFERSSVIDGAGGDGWTAARFAPGAATRGEPVPFDEPRYGEQPRYVEQSGYGAWPVDIRQGRGRTHGGR